MASLPNVIAPDKDTTHPTSARLRMSAIGWLLWLALCSGIHAQEEQSSHWAFQKISRPSIPILKRASLGENPIDLFISEKLDREGKRLSKSATPEQLIRRAYFDLIGLPPTPTEVESFVNDRSPDRLERVIERLLQSPHYGERWGRHWLDLARYAETDGFEHDTVRPHSWRYRDYVIDSFNQDKPYDQFVREQLAGDELWPDRPQALVATGFNLLGPDMVDSSDQQQRRQNTLNDITDTTSLVFLGITLGCARCHDHKSEPYSQRDYYRMQAFFSGVKFEREQPIPTATVRAQHELAMSAYEDHPALAAVREKEKPIRDRLWREKVARLPAEAQIAHRTAASERNAEQANLVLETQDKVAISDPEIEKAFEEGDRKIWQELVAAARKVPKPPALPKAQVLARGIPAATHVLVRGDYSNKGSQVDAGFPEHISRLHPGGSSRGQLADWVASPENPLTARVMVNRIWLHHFGQGIVPTPSDFGTRGGKPTHPELLDWLASEFMAGGWSIQAMHRIIMLSRTWQQTSEARPDGFDPANLLYSRMNKLRLEGEVIRDSLLSISGTLNPKLGGPGVYPPIPKELFQGAAGWKPSADPADHTRRSVYIFARRNLRFPFLEVFDAPDSNLSCSRRDRSTTAPQALTLLNADEVVRAAQATAAAIQGERETAKGQIESAYQRILGRKPIHPEIELGEQFLSKAPLAEYCRALFNLNEFVYLN